MSTASLIRLFGVSSEEAVNFTYLVPKVSRKRRMPRAERKILNRLKWFDEGEQLAIMVHRGWTVTAAARSLGIPEQTARDHLRFYEEFDVQLISAAEGDNPQSKPLPATGTADLEPIFPALDKGRMGRIDTMDAVRVASVLGRRMAEVAQDGVERLAAAAVAAEAALRRLGVDFVPISAVGLLEAAATAGPVSGAASWSVGNWMAWLRGQFDGEGTRNRMLGLAGMSPEEQAQSLGKPWSKVRAADFALRRLRLEADNHVAVQMIKIGSNKPACAQTTAAIIAAATACIPTEAALIAARSVYIPTEAAIADAAVEMQTEAALTAAATVFYHVGDGPSPLYSRCKYKPGPMVSALRWGCRTSDGRRIGFDVRIPVPEPPD